MRLEPWTRFRRTITLIQPYDSRAEVRKLDIGRVSLGGSLVKPYRMDCLTRGVSQKEL